MLRKTALQALFVVLIALSSKVLASEEQVGSDAARSLLIEAVEYYKDTGSNAFAAFSRQGPFVKDDLYVFAMNVNGIMLASGGPSVMLIGRDIFNTLNDEQRVRLEEVLEQAETGDVLQADYLWSHWDLTGPKITKHVYFQRVGDIVLAVGYYQPRASSRQAKELLVIAEDAVRINPRETFAAINGLNPRFYQGDLYVFVVELNTNRFVAHGSNLRLVGRDFSALADRVGKPFGQEALNKIGSSEIVEFDYLWEHPITGDIEHKHAFARKVGDYLVTVGYYQPYTRSDD